MIKFVTKYHKERELILLKNKIFIAITLSWLLSIFVFNNYADAKVIVESKDIIKDKPKIELYIPQLRDLVDGNIQRQINQQLTATTESALDDFNQLTNNMLLSIKKGSLPAEYANRLTLVSDYEVKLLNKNIVSILQYGYQDTGGAHPMSFAYAQTFNIKTGKNYALKDLFQPMSSFAYYLTEKIKLEIKLRNKQDNYIFTGLQEQQKFFLTREGLFIYYQPYEIAPYSEGFIYFFFPYSDLPDIKLDEILY